MTTFTEDFDAVVVGFGDAGGVAAIELADAGAKVLLVEKSSVPGGISICAGGGFLATVDPSKAYAYLEAISGGRTPSDVLRSLADGMADIERYLSELGNVNNAVVAGRGGFVELKPDGSIPDGFAGASYPLPGYETFYFATVKSIPEFVPERDFPAQSVTSEAKTRTFGGGLRAFKVIYDNVMIRDAITVQYSTAGSRLLVKGDRRRVAGITLTCADGSTVDVAAKAVVLACGGFEGNSDLKLQYFQGMPLDIAAGKSNTGDGILMAQDMGAALWHMWHVHGAYGFRHPSPDYPYLIRTRRFPNWRPGKADAAQVKMPWIMLDQTGRRYMNEYDPYVHDTNHRAMHHYDPATMSYPRIPSLLVCDRNGLNKYPLGQPTYNDPDILHYKWSEDNSEEIKLGIIKQASTLKELANQFDISPDALEEAVARWNDACQSGKEDDFGRPTGTMVPLESPPYYAGYVYPMISNTQGGVVHNVDQQVMDVFNEPIYGLYAAGEVSSVFGHLYSAGGNLAECIVSGRNAASHIASEYLGDRRRVAAV